MVNEEFRNSQYILKSEIDGSYYSGSTHDLRQRLKAHNQLSVQSTKAKAPYKIVWYSAFERRENAIEFEKYLKTGSGIAFAKKHLRDQ